MKAKENWIDTQREETETCVNKTIKKACHLMEDLSSGKRIDPQLSETSLGRVYRRSKDSQQIYLTFFLSD